MFGGTELTRRNFIWSAAGVAALSFLPQAAAAADGKILKLRSRRDIQVLDPGWMIGDTEIDLQYACLGSLAVYQPGEALSWRPSPFVTRIEQPDDLRIEFDLKPGIQWSGGFGELTAEDVKFSFERLIDPANEAPWKDKWGALQEVQVTGTYSGVIVLKQPFAPLWLTTICDGTGSILSKKAVESVGGKYTTEFPAICGPYQVKQWVPKQRVELVRNPLWSGDAPHYDEIHILFIDEPQAARLAYEAGEVDLTHVSLEALATYRETPPDNTTLYEGPGLAWTWMGMNTGHTKLQDVRIRQAIQHAVDVNMVIDAAYGGARNSRARGVVPAGLLGHRTETALENRDLDKAKALLAEAGANGLTLELKVLNEQQNIVSGQVIQANLAEVGIVVTVIPLDAGPFWNLGLEAEGEDWKELQLWIMRYQDAPDPSQQTQWYVSSQIGIWNWERWKDPAFDEMHQAALVESDAAKRTDLYLRMQDLMEKTGAYVWLVHEPVNLLIRRSLSAELLPPDHLYLPGMKPA